MTAPIIVWFRNDLRLRDNPALSRAAHAGIIIPIWIQDSSDENNWQPGAASRCWLHESLKSLNQSLDNKLLLFRGSPEQLLLEIIDQTGACAIYWNRLYTPHAVQRDRRIKAQLRDSGVSAESFNGSLLWEPWTISKPDGTPYKVFTPFYKRGCLTAAPPSAPLPAPEPEYADAPLLTTVTLDQLGLLPQLPWGGQLLSHWQVNETDAFWKLHRFVTERLDKYSNGRDLPAGSLTSELSPYLQWGQLSPRQIWHYAVQQAGENCPDDLAKFQQELGWREFSYYQLFHNSNLPEENIDKRFDRFPWHQDASGLECWQQGRTGFPIIDAGMRQLWQTGYMHNRVRMLVASFLVKNQLIHWHEGASGFWNTLLDADLASISASWQWVAGCGADAAPYFRIFNPVVQGEKFDPRGEYVRYYLPELNQLPDKYIHCPWEAPQEILEKSGLILGKDYPIPILDLKVTRQRALDAFSSIKSSNR